MKVREIMTPNPDTCSPETSLLEVARTMEQRDCGALPIITIQTSNIPSPGAASLIGLGGLTLLSRRKRKA